MKKEDVFNMPTIAYYSGYNGIEIKDINEEKVLCVSGAFASRSVQRVHNVKLYYDGDKPYFMIDGNKIPLDECLRT